MEKTKIILHLGVHKTVTTHIQSKLYNSREILKENNIGYIGLDETRDLLTFKLENNTLQTEEVTKFMPFSNFEQDILNKKYQKDIQKILNGRR